MNLGTQGRRRRVAIGLALGGFGIAVLLVGGSLAQDTKKSDPKASSKEAALEDALKKARGDGKYALLYRQIEVDEDKEFYGEFKELGLQRMRRYKGHNNLPAGYWVYVYPHMYIWRDLTATPNPRRAWGPEQAIGAPDTTGAGDFGTAWASMTPDGNDEWLVLEYATPVVPSAVLIHETWNPGAVSRIVAFTLDGKEKEIWTGTDPTPTDKDRGISEMKCKGDFKTNRIKLYIDSKEVRGWNEIDAVGLVDGAGKTQWAIAADASSTSADSRDQTVLQALIVSEQRIRLLEQEIKQLKETMEEMKKHLKKEK